MYTFWNLCSVKQYKRIRFRDFVLITALCRGLESCYLLFQHNKMVLICASIVRANYYSVFSEMRQNNFAEIHIFFLICILVCTVYTRIFNKCYSKKSMHVNFFSLLFNSLSLPKILT